MPQSINSFMTLSCKSIDWFLYGKDFCHERVKALFTHHTSKVCPDMSFAFSNWVFFHEYDDPQDSRERVILFISFPPLLPASKTLRH